MRAAGIDMLPESPQDLLNPTRAHRNHRTKKPTIQILPHLQLLSPTKKRKTVRVVTPGNSAIMFEIACLPDNEVRIGQMDIRGLGLQEAAFHEILLRGFEQARFVIQGETSVLRAQSDLPMTDPYRLERVHL